MTTATDAGKKVNSQLLCHYQLKLGILISYPNSTWIGKPSQKRMKPLSLYIYIYINKWDSRRSKIREVFLNSINN